MTRMQAILVLVVVGAVVSAPACRKTEKTAPPAPAPLAALPPAAGGPKLPAAPPPGAPQAAVPPATPRAAATETAQPGPPTDAGRDAPETPAPRSAEPDGAAETPDGSARIKLVNNTTCTLAAADDRLTAQCEGPAGTLACTAIARGDLAPAAGEERVFRCQLPDQVGYVLAVVSAAGEVMWTMRLGEECNVQGPLDISLVDVVEDAQRELRTREGPCSSPGLWAGTDSLWKWHGDGMQPIGEARYECQWTGATAEDENGEFPDRGANPPYVCAGEEFELGGSAHAPRVTLVVYAESTVPDPQVPGGFPRQVRERDALRWDPTTFRLVPVGSGPPSSPSTNLSLATRSSAQHPSRDRRRPACRPSRSSPRECRRTRRGPRRC